MNSTEFAHIWLETHGLFDKDSDYDGWLGKSVEEVWHFIAKQGHSGGSSARTFQLLQAIYEAYDNPDDPIWKAYWESDEGRKLKESFGVMLTEKEYEAAKARIDAMPEEERMVKADIPTATPKLDKFTQGMLAMPNPTSEQLNDPLFTAIWEVIKTWDINVPEYYEGYCGATGSHVALILNALNARREMGNEHQETHVAQIVVGDSWWDVTLVASIQDQRSVGVIVTEVKKA